jgi:hypothetical protein
MNLSAVAQRILRKRMTVILPHRWKETKHG